MNLNDRALRLADRLAADAAALRIAVSQATAGRPRHRLRRADRRRPGRRPGHGPRLPGRSGRRDAAAARHRRSALSVGAGRHRPSRSSPAWPRSTPAGRCPSASSSRWGPAPCAPPTARKSCSTTFPAAKRPAVRRRRPGDAQAADAGSRRPTSPRSCNCRPTGSRCWPPRPPASPARCRWSPAPWRRPCTSCTN